MKRFGRDEIHAFLKALDRHSKKPFTMIVIGGAAGALSFGMKDGTLDIDTANNVARLEAAHDAAQRETGLAIPLGRASVFDAPYEYESRLRRVSLSGLRRLRVLIPEKHDWALMKVPRLLDKDIEHVKAAARSVGFDKAVFRDRFLAEMTHIEPRKRLIADFLAMMEELYGEAEADLMETAIRGDRNWR